MRDTPGVQLRSCVGVNHYRSGSVANSKVRIKSASGSVASVSTWAAGARSACLCRAAASDLQFALREIANEFIAETGKSLRLNFGSSGNFRRQIAQGAPFQLYLSAAEDYVLALHREEYTRDRGTLYAIGRIAIIAPKGNAGSLVHFLHILVDTPDGLKNMPEIVRQAEHIRTGHTEHMLLMTRCRMLSHVSHSPSLKGFQSFSKEAAVIYDLSPIY